MMTESPDHSEPKPRLLLRSALLFVVTLLVVYFLNLSLVARLEQNVRQAGEARLAIYNDLAGQGQVGADWPDVASLASRAGDFLIPSGQVSELLARHEPVSAAASFASRLFGPSRDVWLNGRPYLMLSAAADGAASKSVLMVDISPIREQANDMLALLLVGFGGLSLAGMASLGRANARRLAMFQAESAKLRALNLRLQREIAGRQEAEQNLQVAEQSVAQSSKLAALGEMSAAVSHELNQPLSAMKTYLAGARLLLERDRGAEALSSFQRIDDLLERMTSLTRQLKSYARKGDQAFAPLDVRLAISNALEMMEPQLKTRSVEIVRVIPDEPQMIMGDKLRLEQVIINLLRNAFDATQETAEPMIEIILAAGDQISLQVRDNGTGIKNLEQVFEPFFSTKAPGEGIGLGLAISSGIVNDLGGRLTARNGARSGAVFEVQLPIYRPEEATAA